MLEQQDIKINHIFDYVANLREFSVCGYKVERPIALKHLQEDSVLVIASDKWFEDI